MSDIQNVVVVHYDDVFEKDEIKYSFLQDHLEAIKSNVRNKGLIE